MKSRILAAVVAFFLSAVLCKISIPILRKWKAGQNILSYVEEHKHKGGTPTMGGLAFVPAAVFSAVLFTRSGGKAFLVILAVGLAYLVVGALDDFLKCKHKQNLGLRAWQKFTFQTLVAVFAAAYALKSGKTQYFLPFFGRVEFGFWTFPFAVFVFLATVNAVNLTDGLDGLAAGTCLPFFLTMGALIALQGGANGGLCTLCFALVGGLGGYLLFNAPPASLFMGDTGSLSLGGFAACVAVFSGNALYLPIVGGCFVLSVISVLLQVIYYKATGGKRIFLMSPMHHHFQKKGYAESKISYAYFAVTALLGALCVLSAL